MPGANDIDSLKFSVVLDSQKFEKELKRVEGLTKEFEKSVAKALAITNLLDAAQGKGAKETKKKADAQKEVVLLTRQELEAKKAAGTITDKELKQLKTIIATDKAILDEQNKQLTAQKKQLDIQDKQERMALRRKSAEEGTGNAITLNTAKLLQQSSIVKGLGSYLTQYFSVFGAATVLRNLVRITGEFEAQHAALRAILQDAAAADNIFNQLQVLAVKSPFTFQNLTAYAKQLTAFSVPVNEVYETTKKLADVSAGLGVDMGRIILAYGQVRSAEFLRGQEVRQFTEAGIPILKELADQFKEIEGHAISVGEVFTRISARQVPFEMVEEAFNRMTSSGGKFYQMQEVLAETVKGKLSNLQDAWEIMLSRIGDQHSGTIKGIITGITNLLADYEKWIGTLSGVIKLIGYYTAAMVTLNTVTKAANALAAIRNGWELLQAANLSKLNILIPTNTAVEKIAIETKKEEIAVQTTLNLARKAAIGILAGIAAIIVTVVQRSRQAKEELRKDTDAINAAVGKLNAGMAELKIGTDKVEAAFVKMKNATEDNTEETKEFEKAVDDLKRQFPKFIDDNIRLADSIDTLRENWARAREEMNKYYADEARDTINTNLKQNRDESITDLSKEFDKFVMGHFKDTGVGKMNSTLLWSYVLGVAGKDQIESVVNEMAKTPYAGMTSAQTAEHILGNLQRFVNRYNKINQQYAEGIKRADEMISSSSLSTTRKNTNDFLFSQFNTPGKMWWLGGTSETSWADADESQRKWIYDKWLVDNADIAMRADESVEQWASRQRELLKSSKISDNVKSVIRTAFEQFKIKENDSELAKWQEDLNAVIKKNGGTTGDLLKPTDDLADRIDKWVKDLNEIDESLKMFPKSQANMQNQSYANLVNRRGLLQAISESLYGKGVKDFSGNTKFARKEMKDAVADLKQEYQDLQELKRYYDKFKELGMSDADIDALFWELKGVRIPSGGFGAKFEDIATRFERLGDKNTARDVRNFSTGRDLDKTYEEEKARQKALEKYLETFQKLIDKTKEYEGIGVAGDISKGIADYKATLDKIKTESEELKKLARDAGLGNTKDAEIDSVYATQKANAIAKLTKLVLGKDDSLLKEVLSDYDLTNWADKSVFQIKQIETALENIEVPQEIKDLLKEYPELLIALEAALKQLADKKLQNTVVPEKYKAVRRDVKSLVSEFKELASAAESFADAVDSKTLKEIANGMSGIADVAGSAVKSYSNVSEKIAELQSMAEKKEGGTWIAKYFGKGGIFGAGSAGASALSATAGWVGAIIAVNKLVMKLAAEEEAQFAREQEARRAARNFGRMQGGYAGTIFGSSDIATVNSRIAQLDKIRESMAKYQDTVKGMQFKTKDYTFWHRLFGFFDSSNWGPGGLLPDEYATLEQLVNALGLKLYDEYGNLNADSLQKILESYEDLTDAEKAWLEQAIQDSEDYAEAMKEIEGIMSDLFGQMADDMVDHFLDNFHKMGDAVVDLGDTFMDLGDTILRSFLRSYILDEILGKYQDEATKMMSKYASGEMTADEYAAWLDRFSKAVLQDSQNQAAAINGLINAFDSRGLINWGDSGDESGSLGSGIKSITEDTANLLASYINAIRADVSYGRIQWERIAIAVEGHTAQYVTLNDYMAQVAANTFDSAQNTQRILAELQSVIGVEGSSGSIVRVQVS